MRPRWPGRASNKPGWTAGGCALGTAPACPRIRLCHWIFRPIPRRSPRSSPGTTGAAWRRGLAIPDRLLAPPPGLAVQRTERVLVRDAAEMASDVANAEPDPSLVLSARPDDAWLRTYPGEIPVDVLSAVRDGELMFGAQPGVAVARAAVTDAPDGTRWVGLSALHADRSAGPAGPLKSGLCEALLAWGARRGATRGYLDVGPGDGDDATALADALGFRPHHRRRYFRPMDTV